MISEAEFKIELHELEKDKKYAVSMGLSTGSELGLSHVKNEIRLMLESKMNSA